MELTSSQIRYLLTIRKLSNGGAVRPSQVAKSLTVSRPSVHRMINQLVKIGLLIKEEDTSVRISDSCGIIAEQYLDGFSSIAPSSRKI